MEMVELSTRSTGHRRSPNILEHPSHIHITLSISLFNFILNDDDEIASSGESTLPSAPLVTDGSAIGDLRPYTIIFRFDCLSATILECF